MGQRINFDDSVLIEMYNKRCTQDEMAKYFGCSTCPIERRLRELGLSRGVGMNTPPRCGGKNNMWNGGRSVTRHGYVLVRVGMNHHLADVRGYAYEHRVVAEKKVGRRLVSGEQIHHMNGDRGDNRPENLEVVGSIAEHRVLHRKRTSIRRLPGEDNPEISCMCGCGAVFPKYDSTGRPRKVVSGHNRGRYVVEACKCLPR